MKQLITIIVLLLSINLQAQKVERHKPPKPQQPQSGLGAKVISTPNTLSSHSVQLSWGASNSQGVDSYNMYRSLTSGGEVMGQPFATGLTCCGWTDSNVNANTTYYYKVTAVCSSCSPSESGFSNETSAVIPPNGQPSPPTNLTNQVAKMNTGGYKDILSWNASSTQGVVYRVYKGSISGGPYNQIVGGLTKLTYTDKNIPTGTWYYVATAYLKQTKQESVYSNETKAVIP